MVERIMDGYDGNSPENPMNWKHEGKIQMGNVENKIELTGRCQKAPKAPGAGIFPSMIDQPIYTVMRIVRITAYHEVFEDFALSHVISLIGK